MLSDEEMKVHKILDGLNIKYARISHPPVYTSVEAEKYWKNAEHKKCISILIETTKSDEFYLVIIEENKKFNLDALSKFLGREDLVVSGDESLHKYLKTTKELVSPFSLINEDEKKIQVIIDKEIEKAKEVSFHPNVYSSTILLYYSDFKRFLKWCGNKVVLANI
jgi:Ala-tRNA(Pro) deacylase